MFKLQTAKVSEKIDVSWCQILLESNVEELLDKDVMKASYLDEMCTVFKLKSHVYCIIAPSSRPSMKEVAQTLLSFAEPLLSFSHVNSNTGLDI
jgi:hypothetical protein